MFVKEEGPALRDRRGPGGKQPRPRQAPQLRKPGLHWAGASLDLPTASPQWDGPQARACLELEGGLAAGL